MKATKIEKYLKIVSQIYIHSYYQTDGTMKFPNSLEGDILRDSYKLINLLIEENAKLKKYVEDCKPVRSGLSQWEPCKTKEKI
jgi:hypothetical protein